MVAAGLWLSLFQKARVPLWSGKSDRAQEIPLSGGKDAAMTSCQLGRYVCFPVLKRILKERDSNPLSPA